MAPATASKPAAAIPGAPDNDPTPLETGTGPPVALGVGEAFPVPTG